MADTDLYSTWVPEEDPGREKKELDEKVRLASSFPVIEETIAWFDDQITIFRNPMTIEGVNISSDPEDVKRAVLFAQSQIAAYDQKRTEYINRFRQYIEEVQSEVNQ